MLQGGAKGLADSRLENLRRLKEGGLRTTRLLLRVPRLSRVTEVVELADLSLNSEVAVIKALDQVSQSRKRKHGVILMVDLGDLREGVWPDDLGSVLKEIKQLRWAQVVGLGANFACYGGVLPTPDKMERLLSLKKEAEKILDRPIPILSAGNSSSLSFLLRRQIPFGLTQLRVGEGILLGRESTRREPIPSTFQDAFVVVAEVIELKRKPSIPVGEIGLDAFGRTPQFEDRGLRKRAILAIGRQDVVPEGLLPLDRGVRILGASSDHMVIDVTDLNRSLAVGDELSFLPNYAALLAAVTSPYVSEVIVGEKEEGRRNQKVAASFTM